jgi:muramoyltetrapeptide carboxypeptidase
MRIKPKALRPGDRIAIVAPGSAAPEEKLKRGADSLANLGFEPVFGKTCFLKRGFMAGPDEARLADLHWAFSDPSIRGIICLRGGNGSGRLLPGLDMARIAANPKPFVGYSDITALHTVFRQRGNFVTFHGPMATVEFSTKGERAITRESFLKALTTTEPLGVLADASSGLVSLAGGRAEGEIVGGNLAVICSTMGTPYELDTKGKVLFIEDINEQPYSVDRMLTHLRNAGKLAEAAAVVVGDFLNADPVSPGPEDSLTLDEVFSDHLPGLGIPVIRGFRCGHGKLNLTLPLGIRVEVDGDARRLTALEAALS